MSEMSFFLILISDDKIEREKMHQRNVRLLLRAYRYIHPISNFLHGWNVKSNFFCLRTNAKISRMSAKVWLHGNSFKIILYYSIFAKMISMKQSKIWLVFSTLFPFNPSSFFMSSCLRSGPPLRFTGPGWDA